MSIDLATQKRPVSSLAHLVIYTEEMAVSL